MSRPQGMNWIRKEKRLAIYIRDHFRCVYCGNGIHSGDILTLDHIVPTKNGGRNNASNLLTACKKCNNVKFLRSVREFCSDVAKYLGLKNDFEELYFKTIMFARNKKIDVKAAKELLASSSDWNELISYMANTKVESGAESLWFWLDMGVIIGKGKSTFLKQLESKVSNEESKGE